MLLRESSQRAELDADVRIVRNAADDPDGGVPHGAALGRFAEALVTGSPELASARSALCRAVGPGRTAHAAGIVASFDGINRVADATGIRLDAASEARAGDLIETLELTELGRARGR
jgi:hypothetical protein